MRTDRAIRIGIACDRGTERSAAGDAMMKRAMASGGIDRPDLVLAFCSNRANPERFFHDMRSVAGEDVPVVGGSAVGIISNDLISYQGFASGVMAVRSDVLRCRVSQAGGLDENEEGAGKELGGKLGHEPDDKLLLIFYDSIKRPPTEKSPPVMNSSVPLLAGIKETLAQTVPVLGAGLVGDYDLNNTIQFCGSFAGSRHVAGMMLGGGFFVYHGIMHGCTPMDGVYHRITKIDGSVLFEIDGKPVVEMIDEMFGNDRWQEEHPLDYLTIGVHCGERYAPYRENDYVNRLITGVVPDKSGVMMFEPDLGCGDEIQFMVRDAERMVESAKVNSESLMGSIIEEGKKPVLALYIDCAGRAKGYSNTSVEEASEIQKVLNRYDVPLFGFYSGVEIAPLQEKTRGLDWTGVLIVLAVDV